MVSAVGELAARGRARLAAVEVRANTPIGLSTPSVYRGALLCRIADSAAPRWPPGPARLHRRRVHAPPRDGASRRGPPPQAGPAIVTRAPVGGARCRRCRHALALSQASTDKR